MSQSSVVVIACRVLDDLLSRITPEGLVRQVILTDYGLHRQPDRLRETVQQAVDGIQEPSLVVLGYGLCGNGLSGIRAGRHTLLIPRADDCIALLLGSYEAYQRESAAVPGTYYLSRGWLESECHPLREFEEYVEKYGPKDAAWILDMQYQHYERLLLVAHNQSDLDRYRPQAQRVARFCERWSMRYEELLGSDAYVRRLVAKAADLDLRDDDLIVVAPGGQISQEQFLR